MKKAKNLPFRIQFKISQQNQSKIIIDDFFKYCCTNTKKQIQFRGKKYEYIINKKDDDKIVGIFKVDRDNRTELGFDNNSNKFSKINIDGCIDYNVFVINIEDTGNGYGGLWLKYHGSGSMYLLEYTLQQLFYEYISAYSNIQNTEINTFKFKNDNNIQIFPIMEKDCEKTLRDNLTTILSYQYDIVDCDINAKANLPASVDFVRKFVHFKTKTKTTDGIFKSIMDAFSLGRKMKVRGKNNENKLQEINLEEYIKYWGELDFDKVVSYLKDIEIERFSTSQIIDKMLNEAKTNINYKLFFK